VRALKPAEGGIRRFRDPTRKPAMQDQWLDDKQHHREKQPDANHCVHPPEGEFVKPVPKIEFHGHVQSRQSNKDHGRARLPNETMLESLKGTKAVGAEFSGSDRGYRHARGHRYPTDPDDDSKHMKCASESYIVHFFESFDPRSLGHRAVPNIALAQTFGEATRIEAWTAD
jgi:hypothetical protein